VDGEGSSNVQWYLDALPFAPRQLDIGDEQDNQDANISAVQVQDSYRDCLCPVADMTLHMILHFQRIWEIGINSTFV
jgi:hypothetical protein